jgi:hypothetical protein
MHLGHTGIANKRRERQVAMLAMRVTMISSVGGVP